LPTFRFLHASDLHIGANARAYFPMMPTPIWGFGYLHQRSHDPDALAALAQFAVDCSQIEPVNAVVLSGDLAHCGRTADLDVALDFVEDPANNRRARGEPSLRDCGTPVVLIPGNHDRFRSYPRCLPGATNFDAIFNGYWQSGQLGAGVQRLWEDDPTPRQARLVLIGADFSLTPGDVGGSPGGILGAGRFGRGKVYGKRLQLLRDATQQAKADHADCAVAWVIHFEPQCGNTFLELIHEDRFIKATQEEGIALVLCGHSHRSSIRTVAETVYSVCGTSGQYGEPDGNHLHLVQFDVEDGTNRITNLAIDIYHYDPNQPGPGFQLVWRT